jgi:tetratricopeptide (TPR) repeat protein
MAYCKHSKIPFEIYYLLGYAYEKTERFEEAIKLLEAQSTELVADFATISKSKCCLSRCYESSGKIETAIGILEKLIQNEQKDNLGLAYKQLGDMYTAMGKNELAEVAYSNYFNHSKTAEATSRVYLGISRANSRMNAYFRAVCNPNTGQILNWKTKLAVDNLSC